MEEIYIVGPWFVWAINWGGGIYWGEGGTIGPYWTLNIGCGWTNTVVFLGRLISSTTSFPNGLKDRSANLHNCIPKGIPIIDMKKNTELTAATIPK